MRPHRHRLPILIGLLLLSLVTLALAPLVGMKFLRPAALLAGAAADRMDLDIFLRLRVPRVLTAYMAGAALAMSGMAFQAVFRNPLATPYTLGVSSGASLGAAAYIWAGASFAFAGLSGVSLAAFAGALLSIGMVYGLTRLRGGFSSGALLLAGVAISFFFSSVIMFAQYVSSSARSQQIVRWLMGSLTAADYEATRNLAIVVAVGTAALGLLTRELNLLMTGEDIAISRGANVPMVKRIIFIAASLMVGGVVAFCGPIGFVGMMVPHIGRLIVGTDHRYLTPLSFLFGGIFLTLCDTFSRVVIRPVEIPVGIVTALLGGPFFLWLLLSKRGLLEATA